MFTRPKKNAKLQTEIDRLTLELPSLSPDDYEVTLARMTVLNKLKESTPEPISPNTLVMGAVNLIGITAILHHEHLHPITSKALSFVTKVK